MENLKIRRRFLERIMYTNDLILKLNKKDYNNNNKIRISQFYFKFSIYQLIKYKMIFGHQKSQTKKSYKRFIIGYRQKFTIINPYDIYRNLKKSLNIYFFFLYNNLNIFIKNDKKFENLINFNNIKKKNILNFDKKWINGILTNYKILKKEINAFIPSLILLYSFDFRYKWFQNEANSLKIPLFGVTDSNIELLFITYFLPSNDDSIESIFLIKFFFMLLLKKSLINNILINYIKLLELKKKKFDTLNFLNFKKNLLFSFFEKKKYVKFLDKISESTFSLNNIVKQKKTYIEYKSKFIRTFFFFNDFKMFFSKKTFFKKFQNRWFLKKKIRFSKKKYKEYLLKKKKITLKKKFLFRKLKKKIVKNKNKYKFKRKKKKNHLTKKYNRQLSYTYIHLKKNLAKFIARFNDISTIYMNKNFFTFYSSKFRKTFLNLKRNRHNKNNDLNFFKFRKTELYDTFSKFVFFSLKKNFYIEKFSLKNFLSNNKKTQGFSFYNELIELYFLIKIFQRKNYKKTYVKNIQKSFNQFFLKKNLNFNISKDIKKKKKLVRKTFFLNIFFKKILKRKSFFFIPFKFLKRKNRIFLFFRKIFFRSFKRVNFLRKNKCHLINLKKKKGKTFNLNLLKKRNNIKKYFFMFQKNIFLKSLCKYMFIYNFKKFNSIFKVKKKVKKKNLLDLLKIRNKFKKYFLKKKNKSKLNDLVYEIGKIIGLNKNKFKSNRKKKKRFIIKKDYKIKLIGSKFLKHLKKKKIIYNFFFKCFKKSSIKMKKLRNKFGYLSYNALRNSNLYFFINKKIKRKLNLFKKTKEKIFAFLNKFKKILISQNEKKIKEYLFSIFVRNKYKIFRKPYNIKKNKKRKLFFVFFDSLRKKNIIKINFFLNRLKKTRKFLIPRKKFFFRKKKTFNKKKKKMIYLKKKQFFKKSFFFINKSYKYKDTKFMKELKKKKNKNFLFKKRKIFINNYFKKIYNLLSLILYIKKKKKKLKNIFSNKNISFFCRRNIYQKIILRKNNAETEIKRRKNLQRSYKFFFCKKKKSANGVLNGKYFNMYKSKKKFYKNQKFFFGLNNYKNIYVITKKKIKNFYKKKLKSKIKKQIILNLFSYHFLLKNTEKKIKVKVKKKLELKYKINAYIFYIKKKIYEKKIYSRFIKIYTNFFRKLKKKIIKKKKKSFLRNYFFFKLKFFKSFDRYLIPKKLNTKTFLIYQFKKNFNLNYLKNNEKKIKIFDLKKKLNILKLKYLIKKKNNNINFYKKIFKNFFIKMLLSFYKNLITFKNFKIKNYLKLKKQWYSYLKQYKTYIEEFIKKKFIQDLKHLQILYYKLFKKLKLIKHHNFFKLFLLLKKM